MILTRRSFAVMGAATALSACGSSKFRAYDGPAVTTVVVRKSARQVHLLHHRQTLRSYPVQLGFAPEGHKTQEGDGRTPEGLYLIDRRNPDSRYHLSIGVSYPNPQDRAQAQARGVSPGGDIFIHGTPALYRGRSDWTAGCVAVSDRHIEEIYAMVRTGTPILITP